MGSIPGSGRCAGGGNGKSTPVLLAGESQGRESLAGYSLWGCRESNTTQQQRAPPKPGGDSPSSPLPASGVASILGLWLHQSSLCLYPHGASPPWAPLPSSHKDTNHLGTGAPSAQLITTNATCPQLLFPKEAPFAGGEDVDILGGHRLQPLIPTIVSVLWSGAHAPGPPPSTSLFPRGQCGRLREGHRWATEHPALGAQALAGGGQVLGGQGPCQ